MPESAPLTPTELVAVATEFLTDGGYRQVPSEVIEPHELAGARVFEDSYGVAAVVVFESWDELVISWPDYQSGLVELMSRHLPSVEAKAWEGYLVLLTSGSAGEAAQDQASAIRYDMTRVRKLVGAGAELQSLSGLERVLRPLLPLKPHALTSESASAVDLLPDLLGSDDLPREAVRVAVDAFKNSKSILDALYRSERSQ